MAFAIAAMHPTNTNLRLVALIIVVNWVSHCENIFTRIFNPCRYFAGKEDRLREKRLSELAKMGNQLRAEMATKGKAMKDEHQQRLDDLKKSFAEAEALAAEREQIKKDAESLESVALAAFNEAQMVVRQKESEREALENANEAAELFKRFDSNANGLLELAEIKTRTTFDRNRNGEVCDEEARYFLGDKDEVDFETFKTLCWPRVKPFLMLEAGLFKPPATADELEVEAQDDNFSDHGEEDGGGGDEGRAHEEDDDFEEETGEGDVSIYIEHK